MNIEDVIRNWKADEENASDTIPDSPIGEELSEEELQDVSGAAYCLITCPIDSCGIGHTYCAITI